MNGLRAETRRSVWYTFGSQFEKKMFITTGLRLKAYDISGRNKIV